MSRVTNIGMNANVLAQNQKTLSQLATYQEQLASGLKVNRVSDDPVAAKQSLRYKAEGSDASKWLDNIDKATAFMNATDSALSEMSQVLDRAKELAVQGANGSQDANSRNALADSVDSYLTRMTDLSNTIHDGRYIFAGTKTISAEPPFARNADDDGVGYSGDLDTFEVKIGPNSAVTVNQNGYELFKGDHDVFQSLIDLRDALRDNDPDRVSSVISDVDDSSEQINNLYGSMGGRLQRLELAKSQLENAKIYVGELVSQAEDVDMTEVISKMQLSQVALEAGLQAGSRVLQPTLLDFLR